MAVACVNKLDTYDGKEIIWKRVILDNGKL